MFVNIYCRKIPYFFTKLIIQTNRNILSLWKRGLLFFPISYHSHGSSLFPPSPASACHLHLLVPELSFWLLSARFSKTLLQPSVSCTDLPLPGCTSHPISREKSAGWVKASNRWKRFKSLSTWNNLSSNVYANSRKTVFEGNENAWEGASTIL